jgi:tetratricopeptide (TPR) repeat protein
MQARLRQMAADATETTAPLANDARERLRSLGYVAPSAPAAIPASSPDPADRIADWRAFETALSAVRGAEVVKRLKELAARNPTAQVFHSAWARALAESGRHTEALRAYRDVVTRWPGDAVLLHDLAVAARDAGQADEALRAEQAALLVDPDYAAAVNGLGLLHADAGRSPDAVASFERATRLDRSDPSYWTNLGNARRALGREDARQAYDEALAIDAAWPDAANGIGVLEVQAGRPAAAIPWFEQALARAPGLVEARLNLGIACQESGQTARAKAYYQAVLQAPPSFARERDAARKLLQGLGR